MKFYNKSLFDIICTINATENYHILFDISNILPSSIVIDVWWPVKRFDVDLETVRGPINYMICFILSLKSLFPVDNCSDASSRCSGRRKCHSRSKKTGHHDGLPMMHNFIPVSIEMLVYFTSKHQYNKRPCFLVKSLASLFPREIVVSHIIFSSTIVMTL